eukprot:scaffold805_cov251-Pinguiococcus_pyrenoidosus.AAC.1
MAGIVPLCDDLSSVSSTCLLLSWVPAGSSPPTSLCSLVVRRTSYAAGRCAFVASHPPQRFVLEFPRAPPTRRRSSSPVAAAEGRCRTPWSKKRRKTPR